MTNTAMVAMSGGVDSSAAAFLMQQAGYHCVGVTLKLFHNDDILSSQSSCCSLDDVSDARAVCHRLNMRHYVFNFADAFREQVIARFIQSYIDGETPNPCIDCNRYIKFDKLLRRLHEWDMQTLATGHYARIYRDGSGRLLLQKALDDRKDQSYMLYTLTQRQLAGLAFPLGELTKKQVREIAEQNGFRNARKKDSQDICFVPDGNYAALIQASAKQCPPPGDFVLQNGEVVGRHKGIIHYTIGQRKHLGLALGEPVFVSDKCPKRNTVTVGPDSSLYFNTVEARDVCLNAVSQLERPMKVSAKLRYRQPAQPARAIQIGENRLRIVFDRPQRAPAPGQAVVLYDSDIVIGGGVIDRLSPRSQI